MRRFICLALFSVWLFFLSGCDRPDPTDENPTVLPEITLASAIAAPSTSTEIAAVIPTATTIIDEGVTETAVPVPTATPIPIPTITPTPLSTEPTFKNLHFVLPNSGTARGNFAVGTKEIFAVWDYANMSATDSVRRVWHYNGAEWLVREELWNMEQYGADGRISDISIYNFEGTGLEPGEYRLFLYINGTLTEEHNFSIVAPGSITNASTPISTAISASSPTFNNLRFQVNGIAQTIFSADVTEVFAVWDYTNVPDRAVLRMVWGGEGGGREYILNWDGDEYGTSGTIAQFSFKELSNQPLVPGFYTLSVYLNELLMVEDSFIAGLSPSGQVYTDPTGTYTVEQWGNYLVIEGEDGKLHSLGSSADGEFGVFTWVPGGEWLVYEILRANPNGTNYGFGFAQFPTYYHRRVGDFSNLVEYSVSPTGNYISVLAEFPGDTSCNTPHPGWQLLTWNGGTYNLRDLLHSSRLITYGIHPRTVGVWENGGLTLELEAGCMDASTASAEDLLLEGIYFLDLASNSMTRVGDLP